ncbi:MAG: DUF302 domain-containing protein [Paracoccaceae bacterium]
MKHLILATGLMAAALPAWAEDIIRVKSTSDVGVTMDALEAAVTGAGATVFARVDHAAGATGIGMELPPAQLLIFGNPALGTPAMQADPLAGLFLPLKVLVYQDDTGVWLAYQKVDDMLDDLKIPDDAEYVGKMEGALKALTTKAAGG